MKKIKKGVYKIGGDYYTLTKLKGNSEAACAMCDLFENQKLCDEAEDLCVPKHFVRIDYEQKGD